MIHQHLTLNDLRKTRLRLISCAHEVATKKRFDFDACLTESGKNKPQQKIGAKISRG